MKPTKVTAIACGICRLLYPDNEGGRRAAEECCRCPRCKAAPSLFIGGPTRTPCRACEDEEKLQRARTNVDRARITLAEAEAHLAHMDQRVASTPPSPAKPKRART